MADQLYSLPVEMSSGEKRPCAALHIFLWIHLELLTGLELHRADA